MVVVGFEQAIPSPGFRKNKLPVCLLLHAEESKNRMFDGKHLRVNTFWFAVVGHRFGPRQAPVILN